MTLTVDDLRDHVGPGPSDDVLERLLNAAYSSIAELYGSAGYDGTLSELLMPSGSLVFLSRRASEVASVKEGDDELEEEDYALRPDGKILRRLGSDGDPTPWTAGYVDVTYTPENDDADERDRVAIALVRLDLSFQPGLVGRSISSWSEQYAQGSAAYTDQRSAILKSLRNGVSAVW